jgi:hypothetical protein
VVRDEHAIGSGKDKSSLDEARAEVLNLAVGAVRFIHLEQEGLSLADWQQNSKLRVAAHRKANTWMATRSHNVICFLRNHPKIKPGGTAECISKLDRGKTTLTKL